MQSQNNSSPRQSDDLTHYGVLGMHWGVRRQSQLRRAINGPGPRRGVSKERTKEMARQDLKLLNDGGYLSKGFTKKRQELLNKRDRQKLEDILNDQETTNNGKNFVNKLLFMSEIQKSN